MVEHLLSKHKGFGFNLQQKGRKEGRKERKKGRIELAFL
jgi:hypothetical protein